VPSLAVGSPFAQVVSGLAAAHCVVGKRRYVASRRYARGTLIKLIPGAGTSLAPQAAVDVLVSSGAPCVVPVVPKGMSLSSAKRSLTAAGCTPGAVKRVRSGRRRGTVVSFNPRAGTRLSPRTVVAIQLSRGRR
jgi:beta-lactam-binding protein with PASTA domain